MPLQKNLAGKSNEVSLHGHLLSFAALFQIHAKICLGLLLQIKQYLWTANQRQY